MTGSYTRGIGPPSEKYIGHPKQRMPFADVLDDRKIGKFGLGFRSCYHVTDTPHILSGSHLAILDPHHYFRQDGGVRVNIVENFEQFSDHLCAFKSVLPESQWGKPYKGTIFRFPLRMTPSQISNKITSVTEIAELLRSFAREELAVSLLFLRNISTIEIYEINNDGERIELAKASISRATFEDYGSQYQTRKVTVRVSAAGSSEEEEWRIIHAPFSETEALQKLANRLEWPITHTTRTLSEDKLNPTIDLAIPCDFSTTFSKGRLFTFLPLPLRTDFPVHINSVFSLTQSRQNLRNADEVGIVGDSEDRARVEWNRLLFDTYVPRAWAILLEVLVRKDHIPNIFVAWPNAQVDIQSGDAVYWKKMPAHVAEHALELDVWPISGTNPPSYQRISSLIVEERSTELEGVVAALVRTGVQITRLPQYLTEIIVENYMNSIKVLSPEIAYAKLGLRALGDEDARVILTYLLSEYECRHIHGLPLVPSVSGTRITLRLTSRTSSPTSHVLFDETEETLFGLYDPDAISLQQMSPTAREALVKYGSDSLNVTLLKSPRVVAYLNLSEYVHQSWGVVRADQIKWLNLFWEWAWFAEFLRYANRFYLVPTTKCTQRPTDTVFDPEAETELTPLLEALSISVIDPRFQVKVGKPLSNLRPTSNVYSLLLEISPSTSQWIKFSDMDAGIFCNYLINHLSRTRGLITQNHILSDNLRSLPIYPLISVSEDGQLTTCRKYIPTSVVVQGVNPVEVPILPHLDGLVYLDLNSVSAQLLEHLSPAPLAPLSPSAMHELMLKHFTSQPPTIQLAFIQYLSGLAVVPRRILNTLATIPFVLSCSGTPQAPRYLVDPLSPFADLFPGLSPRLPLVSHPTFAGLVDLLRNFELFVTHLSMDIVKERVRFMNSATCHNPEFIASCLIHLLNDAHSSFYQNFDFSLLSSDCKWIPTTMGLRSPLKCRDSYSHQGKTDLFDEAMPLVIPGVVVGPRLRNIFGWNNEVSIDVVSKQLVSVLKNAGDLLGPVYHKVLEIVKELGTRGLAEEQLSSLRQTLYLMKWVPTQNGTLEMVEFALLGSEDIPEVGFYNVAFDSIRHPDIYSFLRIMGCVERFYARPTKKTIFQHLAALYHAQSIRTISQNFTRGAIQLLAWLPRLDPEDRDRIFVPDDTGFLCPYDSIYFNDVGNRAALHNIESGSLAHPDISPDLASDLGLQRLGLMGFQEQSDDLNIDWTAAIRARLQGYADHRLLLDLISIASDARATEVNILLDSVWGPTEALLSPRCQDLQHSPALVMQYNGIFAENNLMQILYSCGAGKFGKKPMIGRYGYGALAMFHATEFAMVISQDQVWFMDPCKTYIGIEKAVLRLPLLAVRRSYGDHLAPLFGLFGFSAPEDLTQEFFYPGTIFRLPLRLSGQLPNVDPIFSRTTTLQNLTIDFKAYAPKCLLFTSLDSISLYDRPRQQRSTSNPLPDPRLQWYMHATRKDTSHSRNDVSANTVTITNPASLQGSHEWRVLAFDTKSMSPPALASLRKQYQLKSPSMVYLAARLDSNPEPVHTLFSTLPYSAMLDLPVHISAPFILTPDMAAVRLDENQGPEVSYNRWLLTSVIPIIYLRMLEDRASIVDNTVYWPGVSKVAREDASTDISTLVGNAVYQMALADSSNYQIFRSRFRSSTHPPRTARFVTRIPRAVLVVLEAIKPDDIIQLSPTITKRLQEQNSRHFSLVTPKYLHKQLLGHPDHFSASILERTQLQELIDFLSNDTDPFNCLSGLSLLPLDDGTLTQFGPASSAPSFHVVPTRVHEAQIFKPSRLVHRVLDVSRLLKIGNLNVKPVAESNIRSLLDDRITPADMLQDADSENQQWIRSFWQVFSLLNVPATALSKYPLIPTLKSGYFLSLGYCKKIAILADFEKEPALRQALAQMGLTVVDTASLSPELRRGLPPSPLNVSQVLTNILNRDKAEVIEMFNALNSKTRPTFISWIRKDWQKRKRSYFRDHQDYRDLPIWNVADGSYLSANEVQMLPKSVTVSSIGPFASKALVGHDFVLVEMGLEPPASIRSLLQIPPRLEEAQDKAYKNLLQNVLFEFTPEKAPIPVPNSRREIRDSTTLYSSRDELFTAAFGSNSEYFIHPAFFQFEGQLQKHGLKRQSNLTFAMFKACVEAFHNTGGKVSQERKERADVLFWFWGEDLPERLTALNQDQLPSLDDFRFISRNQVPRPLGSKNDGKYMRQLPAILSPNELVRAEFHPIAWTQRGFYRPGSQPHPDLVKIHPNLSVPTAEEVVNHLVALATRVAPDVDQSCRSILLDHLEQTYEWLNKHADDAKPFLQKCKTEEHALFLNTEVPHLTPMGNWNWKRAEHILLNSESDREYLQYPRVFIKSFRPLLVAAGAVSIDYGKEVKPSVEETTNEVRHLNLYSTLDRMRRKQICIDVNLCFESAPDKPLHAHRTCLAAYSPYFMKLFSKPETMETRVSLFTEADQMADFAYTSQEPDLSNEGNDRVKLIVELLSLAHLWEMSDAQHILQNMIVTLKIVDMFNLETIRDVARRTESKGLMEHCDDFAERNKDLIRQVKEEVLSLAMYYTNLSFVPIDSKSLVFESRSEDVHPDFKSRRKLHFNMSGRGKGGKGLGKGGAKRHRKILRDNIQGITKPAIRRLARRGGVKRISGLIYEETRGVLKIFLENVIRDSVTYTEHAKRKTVTALDVVYALKRSGRTLYGFGA
ncbi:hypothetical protein D9756_009164 [Leucocoprinus leucothites]|nr:hypothetical protein D9756_009164 [Leucoagaricus leucothites]